jgi:hypothetical protein
MTPEQQLAEIRQWQQAGILPPGDDSAILNHYHQLKQQQAGKQEALGYAAQLQPQHIEHLRRIDATGGPQALVDALIQTGLSREAIGVIADAYDQSGGFAGLVQTFSTDLQGVAESNRQGVIDTQIAATEPQEGDSAEQIKLKQETDMAAILANPEAHRLAADAGVNLTDYLVAERKIADGIYGQSVDGEEGTIGNTDRMGRDAQGKAYRWPKISEEQHIAVAAAFNRQSPKQAEAALSSAFESSLRDGLHARLATKDAVARKQIDRKIAKGELPSREVSPEMAKWSAAKAKGRGDLEQIYDELDTPTRPATAPAAPQPWAATADHVGGHTPAGRSTVGRRAALEAAYGGMDWDESEPSAPLEHEITTQSNESEATQ